MSPLLRTLWQNFGAMKDRKTTKLPHTSKFLQAFSKFGFCITPRLWKKEEILCIAIVILDPRLQFAGILQKDGKAVDTSYRGMALLHPMVQRVFYERLRSYGFVNPQYHPEKLQSFSSVVINGGGSWQQNATWHFPVTSRFQMKPEAKPFHGQGRNRWCWCFRSKWIVCGYNHTEKWTLCIRSSLQGRV